MYYLFEYVLHKKKNSNYFFRSVKELERLSRDLKAKINEIERLFGTVDKLRRNLKEKEAKYGKDVLLSSKIEKSYQVSRKILYSICRIVHLS